MPEKYTNWMTESKAEEEIGADGLRKIRELQEWLGFKDHTWTFRRAPSIITRSEVSLYGISMPRFAVRVYLNNAKTAFVNARRIIEFQRVIGETWAKRENRQRLSDYKEFDRAPSPLQILSESSRVGDSLLFAPRHIRDNFHVLSAKLGRAYGEGHDALVTPYVKHIDCSGGGLCAQVACFMATALRHEDSPPNNPDVDPNVGRMGVYSPAEVTVLATSSNANEIPITGLDSQAIGRFLTKTGRPFSLQRVAKEGAKTREGKPINARDGMTIHEVEILRTVLRGYLLGKMPVIVPVDAGRLRQNDEFSHKLFHKENNGLSNQGPATLDSEGHAVVLVGCARSNVDQPKNGLLLMNDPSDKPFLKIRCDHLWHSGTYDEKRGEHEKPLVRNGRFIPVLPAAVRVPLANADVGEKQPLLGLLYIAKALQAMADYVKNRPSELPRCDQRSSYHPGEYQLIDSHCDDEDWHIVPPSAKKKLRKLLQSHGYRWYWVQLVDAGLWQLGQPAQLWIWRAENEFTGKFITDMKCPSGDILIGVLKETFGKPDDWQVCWSSEIGTNEPETILAPQTKVVDTSSSTKLQKLLPAIITSFHPKGLHAAMESWQPGGVGCEIYAFMQEDESLLQQACDIRLPDVAQRYPIMYRMAEMIRQGRGVRELAASLAELAQKANTRIHGFATYFPEILSDSSNMRRAARDAIRFVLELSRHMQRLKYPTGIVEIVGGSIMTGVWPAQKKIDPSDKPEFIANRLDYQTGMLRLQEALHRIVRDDNTQAHSERVYLALEIEPGPLYLLNSWPNVVKFCKLIGEDENLKRIVGVNVDVAHCALAGIEPDRIHAGDSEGKYIWQSMLHAHICDQGGGHFGDAMVGEIGLGAGGATDKFAAFKPWLKLFSRRAAASSTKLLPFRNSISVEHEAALRPDMPWDSVRRLVKLGRQR